MSVNGKLLYLQLQTVYQSSEKESMKYNCNVWMGGKITNVETIVIYQEASITAMEEKMQSK